MYDFEKQAVQSAEHDLDTIAAFVSAFVIFDRCLSRPPAWDASAYLFVFQRISEPIGIITTITWKPFSVWKAAQQGACANVVADLSGGDKEADRASLAVANGMQFGIRAALRSANQTPTPPFLTPRLDAVRWALRYVASTARQLIAKQSMRGDHDGLFFAVTGSQPHHHLSEEAFVAPSLPTVAEGLVWAIFLGRVSPPQTIAIDEDNTTQDPPVIDTWLAVGFREVRFKTCNLHVAQPEKITHITARFRTVNHAAQ